MQLTLRGVMVFSVSAGTSITSFRSRLVIIGGLSWLQATHSDNTVVSNLYACVMDNYLCECPCVIDRYAGHDSWLVIVSRQKVTFDRWIVSSGGFMRGGAVANCQVRQSVGGTNNS